MGLGITRASLVSAICDDTGDSGPDSVVKVRRLINRRGTQFCKITNWPFLRSDLSFDVTNAGGWTYSGASYLPTTFKKVITAYLMDGDVRCPFTQVGVHEAADWHAPADNEGMPDEFCITRMESGYWQMAINRVPDQTYTVYFEIALQWSDLTEDTSETVMPKDYYDAFVHFCDISKFRQQGDMEQMQLAQRQWWNPRDTRGSILGVLLSDLSDPHKEKRVIVDMNMIDPFFDDISAPDYQDGWPVDM